MRASVSVVVIAAAVLIQAAVVNRLPLPWGPEPDVVLVAVVAIALTGTPVAGAVAGFAGGLAMDILPPADHEMGRYALTLCLAGYLVALLRANTGAATASPVGGSVSIWLSVSVVAVTAVGVALADAFVGLVMGDPRVGFGAVLTGAALSAALTAAVSPLVLLPFLRLHVALTDDEFATIQGPTRTGGW